ncbi:MutS-related protein [Sphingobacterium faecale]|uniref:DNA mismatch repair protein n=1 Tax=Sphingobacterium faecale TaxID=2803775 RepID=A0ABS1QY47_9SPHI|nr:DNA mismatch repair protein [Sphingobacterium faecale]MBL1407353.1 DNA mismatch repair protein [Sphingobacterium faecale]
MALFIDQQTLDDLIIFSKGKNASICSFFNQTVTRGGEEQLITMLQYPMNHKEEIQERVDILRLLMSIPTLEFPFTSLDFSDIEQYLSETDSRSQIQNSKKSLKEKLRYLLKVDAQILHTKNGIAALQRVIQAFVIFAANIPAAKKTDSWNKFEQSALKITETTLWKDFLDTEKSVQITDKNIHKIDQRCRFDDKEVILGFMKATYELDALIAVAQVALNKNLTLPLILEDSDDTELDIDGLYHPLVPNAVPNKLSLGHEEHILFLTGANMAGKSTFMKSLGISLYLAHLGFPIPAKHMRFKVKDGLFTTINLSDNISSGYSHFYAEVLRVKRVAVELGNKKKLYVFFDELFRGTNVKDAYDGTLELLKSFAHKTDSFFLISTHITEVAEELSHLNNIHFAYLPTILENDKPVYTYTLEKGVSEDRHGMVIIENEKILEILA